MDKWGQINLDNWGQGKVLSSNGTVDLGGEILL